MDRRSVLGMSKAELTMVRVGHVVALLSMLVLLPLLPFLALFVVGSKLTSIVTGPAADQGREYEYEPEHGSSA